MCNVPQEAAIQEPIRLALGHIYHIRATLTTALALAHIDDRHTEKCAFPNPNAAVSDERVRLRQQLLRPRIVMKGHVPFAANRQEQRVNARGIDGVNGMHAG